MIDDTETSRRPRERPPRRKRRSRTPLLVALVLLVFAFGVALGEALHDNPQPGGLVTLEHSVAVTVTPLKQ